MTSPLQLRGHRQCCARQQAVVSGHMSKHGYEVRKDGSVGWFAGVCRGEHYAPIEHDRAQLDLECAAIDREVARLRKLAKDLTAKRVHPKEAKSGKRIEVRRPHPCRPNMTRLCFEDELVPFAEAPEWHQKAARTSAIWDATRRAELGETTAAYMRKMAEEYNGEPLIEVERPSAASADPPGRATALSERHGPHLHRRRKRPGVLEAARPFAHRQAVPQLVRLAGVAQTGGREMMPLFNMSAPAKSVWVVAARVNYRTQSSEEIRAARRAFAAWRKGRNLPDRYATSEEAQRALATTFKDAPVPLVAEETSPL